MTNGDYWAERQEQELNKISFKTEKEINAQLDKYYMTAFKQVIADFEAVYNKLIATIGAGRTPTVADLYALDKYWQLQGSLRELCEQLGNKEVTLLSKKFEEQWEAIYEAAALPSDLEFAQVSTSNAKQMVNSIWVADGKSFSDRIWGNTEELIETLNQELINVVATGRSSDDLRKKLQERFNVSRARANTLIRTEVAHIQDASAEKRYKDSGLEEWMFLGREEHDIGCQCKKLDGTIWRFDDPNAPKLPQHPNCRCRRKPIMNNELLRKRAEENRKREQEKRAKKREADELREQAQQLRAQAKTLKAQGKTEEAKLLEAEARTLEKKYKAIYAQL